MFVTPLTENILPPAALLSFEAVGRLRLEGAATSHPGWCRDHNGDRFGFSESSRLLVLADGSGAHPAGGVAADHVVRTVIETVAGVPAGATSRMRGLLEVAIRMAHERLDDLDEGLPKGRMCSTVVTAWCSDSHCVIAHVGDSRAYLLRGGELRVLTVDHRPAGALLRAGRIDWKRYRKLARERRELTSCLGGGVSRLNPELSELDLRPGDRLMLCSDGLTDLLDEETLAVLLRAGQPLDAACALEARALEAGGDDNVTVVVADFA